jgi:hypothetical protein
LELRKAFTAASKSQARWDWFRRKSPAAIGAGSDTAANRATPGCVFCWSKPPQVTGRSQAQWRSKFFQLALRRGRKIAKVAMARKLAVHLYGMWRQGWDYGQFEKLGSHAGELGNRHGVQ